MLSFNTAKTVMITYRIHAGINSSNTSSIKQLFRKCWKLYWKHSHCSARWPSLLPAIVWMVPNTSHSETGFFGESDERKKPWCKPDTKFICVSAITALFFINTDDFLCMSCVHLTNLKEVLKRYWVVLSIPAKLFLYML